MAEAIGDRANVFIWNWTEKAESLGGSGCPLGGDLGLLDGSACLAVPYDKVENAGKDLAAALDTALCKWDSGCATGASSYAQPIHFVGHSLGTGVVTYASKYIAVQYVKYKSNIDQLTFHDSAYLSFPPADSTLAELKTRLPFPVFIDNYRSLVQHVSLWSFQPQNISTNIVLPPIPLLPFQGAKDCKTGQATISNLNPHGYGYWWYTSSYEDFTCKDMIGDITVPPLGPPHNGTYWSAERTGDRSDVAFIYLSLIPFEKWLLSPISRLPSAVGGSDTYLVGTALDLAVEGQAYTL